ncbi:Telomeric single stranded DNA binding POT1/Cdc13 domain-containing protein [Madurella fahalii]|uniref:Telomeric single stranded DNA binding POT1/Cdc13 domain-containing protein n=1 Tax=Madurella fahalii TaxID=1157608 RepID=A0ABQ0GDI1_9PEZI
MVNKVLILAGAPESSVIDWASTELLSGFHDTIARFLDNSNTGNRASLAESSASEHAAWRSLSLDQTRIPIGFSHQYAFEFDYLPRGSATGASTEFLTTASISFAWEGDNDEHSAVLSQFYEHSIAVYQDLPSSQLISCPGSQVTSFISDGSTSFLSRDGSQAQSLRGPLQFRGSDILTDLESIPSAAYLLKILPQTMTCNLIVGIISISQPRMVKTRWGATRHLVEVLVGDETRAGFAITYWLPSDSLAESPLAGLRPQDILLMQNVALNVFTKKVYGSSLRKELTKVYLLYRMRLDAGDTGGYYSTADLASNNSTHPQLEKTQRVRDWVLNFVGQGSHAESKTSPRARWDRPPADDTQLT